MTLPADEYLAAFLDGVEFSLLAIEGRIAEGGLDAASAAALRRFVDDYAKVLASERKKAGAARGRKAPVPSIRLPGSALLN